jgi:hypothetical protein
MRVGPGVEPARGPALIIAAMTADIDHGIDRGGAADDLAAGAFKGAAVHRDLGFGEVHPVVAALLQYAPPAERDVDPRVAVPTTGFEQQNRDARVLAEAIGKRAPGRAGADNHIGE